jgi:DHA3 family tetracycline resistance protein-like MFS transporter
MVAIVLVYAAGEAFFGPAFSALVPVVLPKESLVQASALEQFVRQSCRRMIGPALGGIIVALVGPGDAFLIDAGTFAVSACAIALMTTSSPGHGGAGSTIRSEMAEGLRYVTSHRWIWVTLLAASLATLVFFGPVEVLLPYLIRNELDGGAGDFGLVLAADGAGSILASIAVGQRGLPRRYLTVLYAAWAGATLPLVGYAVAESVWQLMLLSAMFGALVTIGLVIWVTLQQTRVPGEMLGRVRSVDWFTSVGLAPVSFALTAPAAELLGVHTTLVLAGLVPAAMTVLLFLVFGLRHEQPPLAETYSERVSLSPALAAADPAGSAPAAPSAPPLEEPAVPSPDEPAAPPAPSAGDSGPPSRPARAADRS